MNNDAEIKHQNTNAKKEIERRPYQAPQLIEIDLFNEHEVLVTSCKTSIGICKNTTKS